MGLNLKWYDVFNKSLNLLHSFDGKKSRVHKETWNMERKTSTYFKGQPKISTKDLKRNNLLKRDAKKASWLNLDLITFHTTRILIKLPKWEKLGILVMWDALIYWKLKSLGERRGRKKKDGECTQKDRELDKYVIKVNYD